MAWKGHVTSNGKVSSLEDAPCGMRFASRCSVARDLRIDEPTSISVGFVARASVPAIGVLLSERVDHGAAVLDTVAWSWITPGS